MPAEPAVQVRYDHGVTSLLRTNYGSADGSRASVVQGKTSTNRWEMQVQGLPGAPDKVPVHCEQGPFGFHVTALPARQHQAKGRRQPVSGRRFARLP
ncbi:hypothetical protein GCM10010211_81700 [Streptomyces albospinus]|uniref:Uncharacterized protein n=1 Tax=Streptomyces albospinus TaxID=285515 RepID=A0ABQ2VP66_9ACTN|nr:hypothetical protein GCM10010211_81700 [Streptomyces albospinus]